MSELSNTFVCLMGMGTVFIGLICIVLICNLMSIVVKGFAKAESTPAPTPKTAPQAPKTLALDPREKASIIAGVCACIAEELGTDADNIKVVSFKRV
ncbi:MAG: OadG family protein [Clostridia bacterium]|nr:OadG family protein [Clostridia bacterium]